MFCFSSYSVGVFIVQESVKTRCSEPRLVLEAYVRVLLIRRKVQRKQSKTNSKINLKNEWEGLSKQNIVAKKKEKKTFAANKIGRLLPLSEN